MSKLVMGYWDCPVCGSKEIRGDVTNCPACGRARGDVQFYVKDYQEGQSLREEELSQFEQLDDEKAQSFSKNPDWYCSFCNSLNSDNAQVCSNCGATRADSEANYFQMLQKKKEREAAEAAAQPQVSAPQKKRRSPMILFLIILLAIVAIFVWRNGKETSGDLTVTGLQWVRNINIEEYKMSSESDWSVPQGYETEVTDTKQELRGYIQVFDHYEDVDVPYTVEVYDHDEYTLEDMGNGSFQKVAHPVYRTETRYRTEQRVVTRPEPQYGTKYYYNIWRWTPSRNVTASGEDHNTSWPEVELGENEREGQRTEAYAFTVEHQKEKKPAETYTLEESEWMKINVNDNLYITAKRSGAEPYISDEKGNKLVKLTRVTK